MLALVICTDPAPAGALTASASSPTQKAVATEAYPAFGLPEISGLAVSVLHPGVVWVNEDSGEPIVRAYDPSGTQVGSVLFEASDVFGGDNRDTEALTMGPGPTLWSADIGDNDAVRTTVLVHTTAEPADLADTTVMATSFRFTYPDGPRDAEAFLINPVDGRAYIASKALLGGGGWYAAPATLEAGATHELTRVADVPDLVSDGAFSPDGSRVALRTVNPLGGASTAYVFEVGRADNGDPDQLAELAEVELPAQVQGESLAFTLDGSALLVGSEGADEPIWSVPLPTDLLPAAGSGASPTTSALGSDPPPSTSPMSAEPSTDTSADGCGLSDPGACVSSSNAILVALLAALVALLAAIVALRRQH